MKTKYIISQLALLLLIILSTSSCKKKEATGANIVRYKVNGVPMGISGPYSQWQDKGISIQLIKSGTIYYIGANLADKKGGIDIVLPSNILENTISKSDTSKFIQLGFTTSSIGSGNSYSGLLNSVEIFIIKNNEKVISGKFNGTAYADFLNNAKDSITITDGYFDIPK